MTPRLTDGMTHLTAVHVLCTYFDGAELDVAGARPASFCMAQQSAALSLTTRPTGQGWTR